MIFHGEIWKRGMLKSLTRVNRAQFTDVSFYGVADSAGAAVVLPGMQGDAEEEGAYLSTSSTMILMADTKIAQPSTRCPH